MLGPIAHLAQPLRRELTKNERRRLPVVLLGRGGVGRNESVTTIVEQLAQRHSAHVVTVDGDDLTVRDIGRLYDFPDRSVARELRAYPDADAVVVVHAIFLRTVRDDKSWVRSTPTSWRQIM